MATANYGTVPASPWPPANIPTRTDDVLVTSSTYDAAGNLTAVTDPAGKVMETTFDNLDRKVKTVENAGGASGETRTTRYEYTDDSWLHKLISENPDTDPDTGEQVTEWVRGVTMAQGSNLWSKRLVYQKIYPNGGTDRLTYTYNRQLQVTGMTDQLETAHSYGHDTLGRLLSDSVTAFGGGVDDTVSRLETGYNERGLVSRSSSYDTAGTGIVNEVVNQYNDFNQAIIQHQEHAGAVDSLTSAKVQYSYADGSANTVRPTGIINPDGTAIVTAYSSTQADALSRHDQVKEGTAVLSSWRYLGLSAVVAQKYDAASNTELTYGSAADGYAGFDRFGRLIETLWKCGSTELVHSSYGRNRASGVVWRRDDLAHAMSINTQDNYYRYDGLQQVTGHDRGNLVPSLSPPRLEPVGPN